MATFGARNLRQLRRIIGIPVWITVLSFVVRAFGWAGLVSVFVSFGFVKLPPQKVGAEHKHFRASLEYSQEATRILNRHLSAVAEGAASNISADEFELIVNTTRKALDEANQVSDEWLEKVHPELRQHYRDDFESGLHLQLTTYEEMDYGVPRVSDELARHAAEERWADWYNKNLIYLNRILHGSQ
ncbi:MAG: hypothetical protein HY706_03135 [Candidatus Hydrogenedentes bacterium]|nr:hypothetical protein [Candidatus Hydrogenedentota bacterium]